MRDSDLLNCDTLASKVKFGYCIRKILTLQSRIELPGEWRLLLAREALRRQREEEKDAELAVSGGEMGRRG